MRKFNKLFILISIILLSFTCISCTPDVNEEVNTPNEEVNTPNIEGEDISKIRKIFKLEQLNMYIDISNEKSEIVSRLKDSVEWSDKLKRDVDYYHLNDIYNLDEVKHLRYMQNWFQSVDYYVDVNFIPEILELISSVPYVEIKKGEIIFIEQEIHYFSKYNKSNCDCGCQNDVNYIYVFIYPNSYVQLWIDKDGVSSRYASLIPISDSMREVLSEENVYVYIYGGKLK